VNRLSEWRQEHPAGGRPVRTTQRFLSAPHVPMAWIATAIKVGALPLAIGILYLKGLHKADGQPFPVSNRMLKPWGITKTMKTKGLPKLAAAGLIAVENRPNASPMITVLRGPLEPNNEASGHHPRRRRSGPSLPGCPACSSAANETTQKSSARPEGARRLALAAQVAAVTH
jgi:hypothetical protein